jgi:Domain of unknown function (DUF5004)
MKKKIFIAVIIAAACGAFLYFKSNTPTSDLVLKETKSLVGKWKIQSITDSSLTKKSSMPLVAINDSLQSLLEFNADSSFSIVQNDSVVSKGMYYADSILQKIFIKKDSVFDEYTVKFLTDSSAVIENAKDSLYYTLVK